MNKAEQRFWDKVSIGDGCWTWESHLLHTGYGAFWLDGKPRKAHRVAWELWHRERPEPGIKVCHSCDNRRCVKPGHLFLGTQKENVADAIKKGRMAYGERSPKAKLSEDDIGMIRSSGDSLRRLAQRFGVSHETIRAVRHRVTWKDV